MLKGISTQELLRGQLYVTSPFDRYPYYQDQLPTTDYIKNLYVTPYKIEQYNTTKKNIDVKNKFSHLTKQLSNYSLESYRKNIFPYISAGNLILGPESVDAIASFKSNVEDTILLFFL